MLGLFLLPIVFIFNTGLRIAYGNSYAVDEIFRYIVEVHLKFSDKSTSEEELDMWITQDKSHDIFSYRPLLDKIGGINLRKSVADDLENAYTWWYEAITQIEIKKSSE